MNPIVKLGAKLAALLIPFPLLLMIVIPRFPMQLFDGEYAFYRQNEEYGQAHDEYCRVLIMGDSSIKSALNPNLLSDDTYNFALGGATPVEEYYCLRGYLKHNKAPEYVICAFTVGTIEKCGLFWDRFVYFHRADKSDLKDMQKQLAQFSDISSLGVSNAGGFAKEVQLYRMYAPQKYSLMFFSGLTSSIFDGSRYKANMENYQEAVKNKGQVFFGTAEYCDEVVSSLAARERLCPDEVTDHYFRSLIGLCEENGIQFVFQSPPYNTSTHIQETVIDDYKAYLESIQQEYPNAIIDENLYWYGPECFGNPDHVNQRGMERYSLETVQKYPEIFQS